MVKRRPPSSQAESSNQENLLSDARLFLERITDEKFTPLERLVIEQVIGLHLTGVRHVTWGKIHALVAVEGLLKLHPCPKLTDDDTDEVQGAMVSLEGRGLLSFDHDELRMHDMLDGFREKIANRITQP
ncbi:MAG TPA: hypothetical protein VJB82_05025 [Candidatus Peribacterales bacterium]|nr:hypothetical protein [Candidatus Peribacterales bacterium]